MVSRLYPFALVLILAIVSIALSGPVAAQVSAVPYGEDFLIDEDAAHYELTGLRRSPAVLETYYPQGAPPNATNITPAVTEWNGVTSAFQFGFAVAVGQPANHLCGEPSITQIARGLDGINSIIWRPLRAGSTIGMACWSTGANECDIVVDTAFGMTASAEAIRTVILHEAGHCAGLGHSSIQGAVMYPSYSRPLNVHPDDRAGICALYGCAAGPPPVTTSPPAVVTPTIQPAAPTIVPATPTPFYAPLPCRLRGAPFCVVLPGLASDVPERNPTRRRD